MSRWRTLFMDIVMVVWALLILAFGVTIYTGIWRP